MDVPQTYTLRHTYNININVGGDDIGHTHILLQFSSHSLHFN